jgi:hypothetical protein
MLVVTSTLVTTTDDTGMVDSASTAGTALSDDPEAQTRSSSSSGRHTMVATTAMVNERCGDAGVEDRSNAFTRGQDKPGPKWRTLVGALPMTPPEATASP